MLKLIQNEWMKLWHKKGTWIMTGVLVAAIVGFAGLAKLSEQLSDSSEGSGLKVELVQVEEKMASPDIPEDEQEQLSVAQQNLQETIAANEQRRSMQTREGIIADIYGMLSLVTLLTIIASAGIVASEFSQGTIKMLLSRPVRRWKILLSKYAVVILFSLLLVMITFVVSVGSAYLFFPGAEGDSILWNGENLAVSKVWGHSIYMILLTFVNVWMISTFAFMIGSVFRSSALAIGLSLFLYFTGNMIVMFLQDFEIAKYILFAHDLTQYETNFKILEDLTMPFSIAVLSAYLVVFLVISFTTFMKRDITA